MYRVDFCESFPCSKSFLTNFGFDTAENEPHKVGWKEGRRSARRSKKRPLSGETRVGQVRAAREAHGLELLAAREQLCGGVGEGRAESQVHL